ncbi:MAG: type II toxin-antitoxin system death-on-curing family toxin [Gammaproteobacteria bacterium]|nr:type II toxin-antitoxin system death-on-curing family toxin [Gammaproteobacteria bacterium]
MANHHYRITWADAIRAHEEALELGGATGVLDENRILAAIERPYDRYHIHIYEKAAALVESVIQNHGFVDGNKRTALYLVHILAERSGYNLEADDESIVD